MVASIIKRKKISVNYSRGSLYEAKTWIVKARNRKLISEEYFSVFKDEINLIGKILNNYIKSIGQYEPNNSNQINEPANDYNDDFF